ncbi:GAF domain-containing protein, partial [bacterium]
PQEIKAAAARLLCGQLAANRTAYYEIDGGEYVIECDHVDGVQSVAGRFPVASFGQKLLHDQLHGDRPIVVDDVAAAHGPAEIAEFSAMQTASYIGVPLRKQGRFIAGLAVHSRAPRVWTETEVSLAEATAERTWAAVDRGRVETALRDSEERLRIALEAGTLATWDWNIDSGKITWSDEHYRQMGRAPGSIEPGYEMWLAAVHPEDRTRAEEALVRSRDEVKPFYLEYRIVWPDGSRRWAQAQGTFQYANDGKPVRMIGVQRDITEAKQWEERQSVLLGELQHRTRNLMGIVRSIAEQTLRSSRDLADFAPKFRDRIGAIARVNGLLSRLKESDRISFDQLLESELDALIGPADREGHV